MTHRCFCGHLDSEHDHDGCLVPGCSCDTLEWDDEDEDPDWDLDDEPENRWDNREDFGSDQAYTPFDEEPDFRDG
jgi:hypothetical protein